MMPPLSILLMLTANRLTPHSVYSNELNKNRLQVLQARANAVEQILDEAKKSLPKISQDQGKYKGVVEAMILEVCLRCPLVCTAPSYPLPASVPADARHIARLPVEVEGVGGRKQP